MLLDTQAIISNAQPILMSQYSANVLYLGKGDASYMPLLIQVVEDFAGCTGVSIDIETSAASNFSSSTTIDTVSLGLAKLKKGARFDVYFVPKGNLGYLRLKYTVVGTSTAGKITAAVVRTDDFGYHKSGFAG